jgi:hypothetical protein
MALVDGKKSRAFKIGDKEAIIVGAPISNHSRQTTGITLKYLAQRLPCHPLRSIQLRILSLYQAIDGRTWYFPEITNRWTTLLVQPRRPIGSPSILDSQGKFPV